METSGLYRGFAIRHGEENGILLEKLLEVCAPEQVYLLGLTEQTRRTETLFSRSAPTMRVVSHYYLLVLVRRTKSMVLCDVQDRIENKLKNFIPVTAIVQDLGLFERWLASGHPFALGTKEKGLLLYNNAEGALQDSEAVEEARWRSPADVLRQASANVGAFLTGAGVFAESEQFHMAAFMLHQATEQSLSAMFQIRTGLRVVTHNIGKLIRYCSMFCYQLPDVFDRERKDGLLPLLQKAYLDSRYRDDYVITANDVGLLTERVQRIVELFKETCSKCVEEEVVGMGWLVRKMKAMAAVEGWSSFECRKRLHKPVSNFTNKPTAVLNDNFKKSFGWRDKSLYFCTPSNGPVAQLNRAFDYGSKGFRFES